MEATYSSSSSITSKNSPPSYLHSVKKTSAKPWRKPAVAPLPPNPPRVYQIPYKVDPINFRDLVQKLTSSAPEYHDERNSSTDLRSVALPPIEIQRRSPHVPSRVEVNAGNSAQFSDMYKDLAETLALSTVASHQQKKTMDSSYLMLNLSPGSPHWFSNSGQ